MRYYYYCWPSFTIFKILLWWAFPRSGDETTQVNGSNSLLSVCMPNSVTIRFWSLEINNFNFIVPGENESHLGFGTKKTCPFPWIEVSSIEATDTKIIGKLFRDQILGPLNRDVAKSRLPANFSGWKRAYHQLKLKGQQSRVGILEMETSKTADLTTITKKLAYHFLSYIPVWMEGSQRRGSNVLFLLRKENLRVRMQICLSFVVWEFTKLKYIHVWVNGS